jgi:hypothetical protein
MQRLLAGARIGLEAARHLAWYLSHRIDAPAPRR